MLRARFCTVACPGRNGYHLRLRERESLGSDGDGVATGSELGKSVRAVCASLGGRGGSIRCLNGDRGFDHTCSGGVCCRPVKRSAGLTRIDYGGKKTQAEEQYGHS